MWNQHGGDMDTAMSFIPQDTDKDGNYSTPDVYGRAAQFYLSLRSSAEQSCFTGEEARVWRGLLTMLALRNVLNLPLRWEGVNFSAKDLLSAALSRPPREKRQLLYPDEREYQWDGETFYALTWAPNGVRQCDLALYSPLTLMYPVADWRRIFFDASEHAHVLRKFFYRAQRFSEEPNDKDGKIARARNIAASTFRDCVDLLQDGERKFVYLWLQAMRNHLYGKQVNGVKDASRPAYSGADSQAKDIIRQHIERYMDDLLNKDSALRGASADTLAWKDFPECDSVKFPGLPYPLISACDIPGGPVFADQICYFRVERNSDNPFAPCNYAWNYRIKGQLNPDFDLYAFLPIHPQRRETCLESGLARDIHMEVIPDPGGDKSMNYIRVSAKLDALGDFPLERDYLISHDRTDKPDTAVCYKYWDGHEDAALDKFTWPLISVWPDAIGTGWKEFYVMRAERFFNGLRLYDETPWEANPDAPATHGSNYAVVKTAYAPDAIPFVREILPDKRVSVGMVTPGSALRHSGSAAATVAVDVGTFSARVFYSMVSNPGTIYELPLSNDKPLEVTKLYDDCDEKYAEMGRRFVSPRPSLTFSAPSVFRRSEPVNKTVVPPLLEGVIYHPDSYANLDRENPQLLVTDLKWNGDATAPYYLAFLQQLCIHVMSILYRERGVNEINWAYALPKSMEKKRGDMRRVWDNLGAFLTRTAGNIRSHVLSPTVDIVAASRFFAANHIGEINKKKGFLVANIGDDMTDVALWRSGDGHAPASLLWHTSVKVAGRRMFTAWIERLLPEIDASVSNMELKKLIRNILRSGASLSAEEKTALVDRLLNAYSDVLKEDYSRLWTEGITPWAMNLNRRLTQSAALLMFCLGYQVGALMNSKIKAGGDSDAWYAEPLFLIKSQEAEPGYFSIAIAGRGSLMWDWLRDCKDKQLCEFFKAGVKAAGTRWPNAEIRIVRDKDPKAAVGKGLLEKPANLDMSEGWGDLPDKDRLNEEIEDSAYYYKATLGFLNAYSAMFNAPTLEEPEMNALAGYAQFLKPTLNDAFKILMETIYNYLEGRKP